MKRVFFIMTLSAVLMLFAACGNKTVGIGETSASKSEETAEQAPDNEKENKENENGVLSIDPDDYYKCVVFELPKEDFRDAAVNHMRAQASIEWVCSADFSVSEQWDHWGISLQWKKGETYYGIPYSDTKVSLDEFKTYLVNGTFTSSSNRWKEVPGNGCMSAVFNAIQQFDPSVAGMSQQLMPSRETFLAVKCGDYTAPQTVDTTEEIVAANGNEKMFEAYSHLKKGDLVITRNAKKRTSHIRMLVEDPVISSNSAGKINPNRSYVKTIEQTNAFDSKRKDGVKTTWFVDHTYTFNDLIQKNYVPITLEIYYMDRSECEIPYLYLDKEITSSVLSKGTASACTVKSNFPLRFVKAELLDKSGKSVSKVVIQDMPDTRSISLRNHIFKLFDGVESGDYTFVLTSGIAIGNAELARVDFTYNK